MIPHLNTKYGILLARKGFVNSNIMATNIKILVIGLFNKVVLPNVLNKVFVFG